MGILIAGTMGGIALADGHVTKGEEVFNKCKICHAVEANITKLGPTLFGIFGRQAGVLEFKYSNAMLESGIVWNDAELDGFLKAPRKYLKKTKMTFPGIKNDNQRADLIAYLKTLTGESVK